MAIRKEQSTYPNALNLKNAMIAKGYPMTIDIDNVYYSGGATEKHLVISQTQYGFRTVVREGTALNFDFMDAGDPEAVRLWTIKELSAFIGAYPGVQSSEFTKPATNYIHVIKVNDIEYTGTDANHPNAMIKALILVLQA